jgi:hypothetical protein
MFERILARLVRNVHRLASSVLWEADFMDKKLPIGFVLLLLILAILACDSSDLVDPNDGSNGQNNPTLFQDDFSDPTSGWATQRSPNQIMDYENNSFRIWVNQPNYDYWSVPNLRFTDIRVEVTASKVAGPDDNDFGVICRYKDSNNFYSLLISSDGYYGIGKRKDGVHQIIGGEGMKHSSIILTGNAKNRLRADCVGPSLTLYVNDEKLLEVQDSDFAVGDVGLLAGSFSSAGVDILFNNFVARKP